MNKEKSSTSIRVIYWIMRIGYFLGLAGGVILLGFLIALLSGMDMESVNFQITLPAKMTLVETGFLNSGGQVVPVRLNDMTGSLQFEQFSEAPIKVKLAFVFATLIIYGALLVILQKMMVFIRNIYQHRFFDAQNQKSLLVISYTLIIVWIVVKISGTIMFFVVEESLVLNSVELTSPNAGGLSLLFTGLLTYVLAKVFAEGRRMEEENRLTV
jgi:hypothetical protein